MARLKEEHRRKLGGQLKDSVVVQIRDYDGLVESGSSRADVFWIYSGKRIYR